MILTNLMRILIVFAVLGYASYKDIRNRRVENDAWLLLGAIGVILLGIDSKESLAASLVWCIPSFAIAFIFGELLFCAGSGGADSKAIWSIGLITPFYPVIMGTLPFFANPLSNIFIVPVLLYSFLATGIYMCILRITKMKRRKSIPFIPFLFMGFIIAVVFGDVTAWLMAS